jgi:hypothetical protein
LHLDKFIQKDHIRKLGTLLLVMGLAYTYFVVNEYLGAGYTNEGLERNWLRGMFTGNFSIPFWTMIVTGLIIPVLLLALPGRRAIGRIVTASVLVNIGMWLKRYIIVVPTLGAPYMPVPAANTHLLAYVPTWVEWSVTAGAISMFCLLYTLFAKFVPIISMWELDEEHETPKSESLTSLLAKMPATPALLAGIAVLGTMLIAAPRMARADQTPATQPAATQPAATVDLITTTDDGKFVLQATVHANGKPLQGAEVQFFAKRSFGALPLGKDTTLDDGTAEAPFPTDLPGNPDGEIDCTAKVTGPDQFAGAEITVHLAGAMKFTPRSDPFPRALWAPKPPMTLVITVGGLLTLAWGSYAYVGLQLVKIRKG